MKSNQPLLLFLLLAGWLTGNAQDAPQYRFSVENMWVINSRFSERALIPYSDDLYILMSDRGGKDNYNKWTGGTAYDVYFIDRSDWTKITRPQGLNSAYSDGPASVLPNGGLVITRTNKSGTMNESTGLMVHRSNLSLAEVNETAGGWTVQPVPEFMDKDVSFGYPALSEDGTMIVFASDDGDGYGGMDLYLSYLIKDAWSEPINLGPTVNTAGEETFPFLHADGNLYFTSDGHPGYGGTDIFVTRKSGRKWSQALNLGKPVNSEANESAVWFNAAMERGFFSSDRDKGKGSDDIYAIFVDDLNDRAVPVMAAEFQEDLPERERNTEVPEVAEEAATGGPGEQAVETVEVPTPVVPATIVDYTAEVDQNRELSENAPGNTEPEADASASEIDDDAQAVQQEVAEAAGAPAAGEQAEQALAEVPEATRKRSKRKRNREDDVEIARNIVPQPAQEEVETPLMEVAGPEDPADLTEVEDADDKTEQAIAEAEVEEAEPEAVSELVKLEESMREYELKNVFFGMNSSRLDSESEERLDHFVELLQQYDDPVVELHAHADATGDHNINIRLSELRARAVMQYLHKQGVPMDRMCYLAYGESDLYLAQKADAALNRRVEFRLKNYDHNFLPENDPSRVEGFGYKQMPMLEDRKYFVQLAALSDMRTFSTYKLKEYGAAICYYQGGLYKYVLGPFDSLEEATVELQKVRSDYRDAFIFKNE